MSEKCEHGFIVIDGYHYTLCGGMIFPTNKRCEDVERERKESEAVELADLSRTG